MNEIKSAKDYLVSLYDGLGDELLVNLVAIKETDGVSVTQGIAITLADLRATDAVQRFIDRYQADRWNVYYVPNLLDFAPERGRAAKDDMHQEVRFVHVDMDWPADTGVDLAAWHAAKGADLLSRKFTALINTGGGYQLILGLSSAVSPERAEEINRFLRDSLQGDNGAVAFNQPYRLPFTMNFPKASKQAKGRVNAPAVLVKMTADVFQPDSFVATATGLEDIDDDTVHIIRTATRPPSQADKPQFEGASEARMSVMVRMFMRDHSRERVLEIIRNPQYAIAPKEPRKLRSAKWCEREVDSAYEVFQSSIPDYVKQMNRDHFLTDYGGETVIVKNVYDDSGQRPRWRYVFTSPAALDLYYANDLVPFTNANGDEKFIIKSKAWVGHRRRRTYREMVMLPNLPPGALPDGRFNMWRGWPVSPVAGDCSLVEELVNDVICGGNTALAAYVWGWMALCVQRPHEQAQTSVAMRGEEGTGKGTLMRIMGRLFQDHFVHVSSPEHLTGNFNGHLLDCLFLFADEALWAGSKKAGSTLKRLITEPTLPIEKKHHDLVNVPNRLKIGMASNEDWIVPAGTNARRYCVIQVTSKRMQDHAWFDKLYEQLDNGGLAALLHKLLNYDLKDFDVRVVPKTEALGDQQTRSMSPVETYWYTCLCEGDYGVPSDEIDWLYPPKDALWDGFCKSRKDSDYRVSISRPVFVAELKRLLPEECIDQKNRGIRRGGNPRNYFGRKRNTYRLEDIEVCRVVFEERMARKFDWPDVEQCTPAEHHDESKRPF